MGSMVHEMSFAELISRVARKSNYTIFQGDGLAMSLHNFRANLTGMLRNAEKLWTVTEKAECRVDMLTDRKVFVPSKGDDHTTVSRDELGKCASILVAMSPMHYIRRGSVIGLRSNVSH
jgi:hypothetical protein